MATMASQNDARLTTRWSPEQSERKRAAVNAEIDRVNKLPAYSSYATHRMRVLNKILQLMSIQEDHSITFNSVTVETLPCDKPVTVKAGEGEEVMGVTDAVPC
ncbi:hypothetical protein EJ110_NYTH29796 [Nymphaea thermarum]|nr:hypothetical protein EJ110_NYTH29796 [Nymphaea thermarum]